MSIEIARYQFHSWSRKGISLNIDTADDLGTGTETQLERAEIPISVTLNDTAQTKDFLLIGPGDIIGVNPNMIVRTEPLNWITNFEPNYLSFVEFYDEDFAWRYTPASPSGVKLRPWLMLLVLTEDEFQRGANQVPLPSIKIKVKDVFPPVTESNLWAHMHSNADIPDSELTDYEKFLQQLNQTMNADPDQLYSRLICPRKLDPNTAYHAFLVPAFETGRLAGLQADTTATIAQLPSWDKNGAKGDMPVYFEWYFRTGQEEDFEYLVKLLEPRPMDSKVGIRDMDASRPGFVQAEDFTKEIPGTMPPILGLEGVLKSPSTVSTVFPDPPASNDFQVELQKIANLPFTIIGTDSSGDPMISVPIYGSNHAKQTATDVVLLDITKSNWVNDLNRDPRTRVMGGIGTTVIQNNQENYMRQAWSQVDGVIAANKIITSGVFIMKVALQSMKKNFSNLAPEKLLLISKPVLSRILGSPTTLYQQIKTSPLVPAAFSGSMRRLLRPKGKLIRKLSASKTFQFSQLIQGINSKKISAAPLNILPVGLPNTQTIAEFISNSASVSGDTKSWLSSNRNWLLALVLIILIVLAVMTGSFWLFGILAAVAVAGYSFLGSKSITVSTPTEASTILTNPAEALKSISELPPQPVFTYRVVDETTTPAATLTAAGADSVEAANYRSAAIDLDKRMALQPPVVEKIAFDLNNAVAKISEAIHPHASFPLRMRAQILFPAYIPLADPEKIIPVMAYPDFEDPMYKKLTDISQEFLMPNIKLVPPNTISLVETNPKFIESYMIGLNHEMGRELLWREYPTDEMGSYFRQFWDVKGLIEPSDTKSEAEMTEAGKDIKPINTWGINSVLGSHNNRAPANSTSPQAVLLIRGELLKRYPNTLIFAQKAIDATDGGDPVIDMSLTDTTFGTEIKFPMYKAEAAPDIKFFGFDLTIDQARGTAPTNGFSDNLGWFFVIQEVPGEPRFGMDVNFSPDEGGLTWADISWDLFTDPAMKIITAGEPPSGSFPDPTKWGADSANMAYILFRKPSMVAVHASEMLEKL